MKKLIFTIAIVFAAFYYLYSVNNTSASKAPHLATPLDEKNPIEGLPVNDTGFAVEKLKNLTIANAQCKQTNLDFSSQVRNIHQILIQALEHELRNGTTERELLSYSSQFKTFYRGYDDLLLTAKTNIEKEKYQFTRSADILNDWRGLSVIEIFSAKNMPIIIQGLKTIEGQSNALRMELELKDTVSKSEVRALLDNDENFNTYLESPFRVKGSPVLSPSVLFVLTAETLPFEEFKHAISLKNFNVNDIAIAITNDLPYEYLEALIKQTASIQDMPILVQGLYDSYANLADLAISTQNIKLLQLLQRYGVYPTNEVGIITGLDIALMHLSDQAEAYHSSEGLPNKYIDTINYLVAQGYKAHGSRRQHDGEEALHFAAPNRRGLDSSTILEPKLKKALHQIELIDRSYNIKQVQPDDSLVSKAISTIELKKTALNDQSTSCESIRKELLAAEGFLDLKDSYDLIKQIAAEDGNTAARLHEIDPVLVNLWRDSQTSPFDSRKQTSDFVTLLKDENYQGAIDYSASTPLTEYETDVLLSSLLRDLENNISIWNARVTPVPPSTLRAFQKLPIEKWRALETARFDFTIRDKYGNDLFSPAALNSPEAVELLLDMGLKPDMNNLGLDVLDRLLENTYEKGMINDSLNLLIAQVEKMEPNHYSRIARIKKFLPDEYVKLTNLNEKFELTQEVEMNKFRLKIF